MPTPIRRYSKGWGWLAEPLRVKLDFEEHDYAVVTASQRSANYSLSVYSSDGGRLIKQVDIPADRSFNEVLLVNKEECMECILSIEGNRRVDQTSPYSMTIQFGSLKDETDLAFNFTTISTISNAGELSAKMLATSGELQAGVTRELIALLEQLIDETHESIWALHAKSLLLQFAKDTYSHEKIVHLAKNIIGLVEASETNVYRVQSLYHLGTVTPDTIKKRSLLKQGMDEARLIHEPVHYARGANFYAISLTRESRFIEALSFLEEVHSIYSEQRRIISLLPTFSNISWANQRAGNFPSSISFAAQHKLLAEEYSREVDVVWSLYNMAISYSKLGEGYLAESFLDESFTRFGGLPDSLRTREKYLQGYLLRERAESSFRLGDFDFAEDYANQMLDFYKNSKLVQELANATFLRAEIALAQNRPEIARKLFREAIDYDRLNGRSRSEGRNYLRLAELDLDQKNVLAAVPNNIVALKTLSRTEDLGLLAQSFSVTVEVLMSLGAVDEAERLADEVAAFVSVYGLKSDNAKFLYRRALVNKAQGKFDLAISNLEKARLILETTLPKVKRRDLRRHYLALRKSVFSLNVDLLIANDDPIEALALVESYKARTLNEAIRLSQNLSEHSPELAQAREDIHKKILLSAASWYDDDRTAKSDLLANTRNLSSALEKIEVASLDEREIALPAIKSIQLPNVRSPDQLLAYYFFGDSNSWLWLIDDTETTLHQLPSEDKIEALVTRVRTQVMSHPSTRRDSNAWKQTKAILELSQVILSPISARLDSDRAEHLTVIPDGPINTLPFALLKLESASKPLIDRVALAYSASFKSMQVIETRAKKRVGKRAQNILVVADPTSRLNGGESIIRLPHSLAEAKAIKAIASSNTKLLVGDKASKASFLRELIEPYSVLHFATHGLLNSREPALSGLTFSKVSDEINYWLAPEISSAGFRADLVVLSACESSVGKDIAGEGLLSLSRAFIEGGANQVVGTLWKVQDKATASLISKFYSGLLDDSLVTPKALQQAQLAVYSDKNNDWRDPYFWAGFQLQGGWKTESYDKAKRID